MVATVDPEREGWRKYYNSSQGKFNVSFLYVSETGSINLLLQK